MITGPEGIGKSTLASQCPAPLFIDTEKGTDMLDVERLEGVQDWISLLRAVNDFAKEEHEWKTLVIDTLDWAEMWCARQLCLDERVASLEGIGYGKGWTMLQERFSKLIAACNAVIASGRNVVLVAHMAMRKFEEPEQMGAYDRWELKLSRKVSPMVKEWADAVLFLNYRVKLAAGGQGMAAGKKALAGERVIYTRHHACWDAKNRFGLGDMLPAEYSAIAPIFGAAN